MKEELKNDCTVIKIRTNENMYYTYMIITWNDLEHLEDCKTFESVQDFANYLAIDKIQSIASDTHNNLLYLYPERKVINRNDIKEIYIEDHRELKAK